MKCSRINKCWFRDSTKEYIVEYNYSDRFLGICYAARWSAKTLIKAKVESRKYRRHLLVDYMSIRRKQKQFDRKVNKIKTRG